MALDNVAEAIAEVRQQMNDLRGDEAGYLQTALREMRKHMKTSWRHAGVEMVRVPGEEKLRVRTSKEQATAESAEPEGQGHEFDEQREEAVQGLNGDGYDDGDESQSIADA